MLLKVCGMKDPNNIQQLAALQPDWMGMIFYEKSPRHVSNPIEHNTNLKRIGVFVNASENYINQKIKANKLSGVQLHGSESPEFCKNYQQQGLTTLKAFSIDTDFDFTKTMAYHNHCDYFVFDAKGKNPGGNGLSYDWSVLKKYTGPTPFLLSGGIRPSSVEAILQFEHPQCSGLDINSGFELEPGIKNIELIKKFKDDLSN